MAAPPLDFLVEFPVVSSPLVGFGKLAPAGSEEPELIADPSPPAEAGASFPVATEASVAAA